MPNFQEKSVSRLVEYNLCRVCKFYHDFDATGQCSTVAKTIQQHDYEL